MYLIVLWTATTLLIYGGIMSTVPTPWRDIAFCVCIVAFFGCTGIFGSKLSDALAETQLQLHSAQESANAAADEFERVQTERISLFRQWARDFVHSRRETFLHEVRGRLTKRVLDIFSLKGAPTPIFLDVLITGSINKSLNPSGYTFCVFTIMPTSLCILEGTRVARSIHTSISVSGGHEATAVSSRARGMIDIAKSALRKTFGAETPTNLDSKEVRITGIEFDFRSATVAATEGAADPIASTLDTEVSSREIFYDKISTISTRSERADEAQESLSIGKILIALSSGECLEYPSLNVEHLTQLESEVRERTRLVGRGPSTPRLELDESANERARASAAESGDALRLLERLAALRRDGLISDADFEQKKRELLSRI